jgi:IS30 family transposase
MNIPLSEQQENLLKDWFYTKKNYVGRDKLFQLIKDEPNRPTRAQVQQWLNNQKVHQLHLIPKKSTTIKPIIVTKPGLNIQIDLIDMGEHAYNDWRYIFTMIDSFSRKAYAEPLKSKDAQTVNNAYFKIANQHDIKPKIVMSDNGSEFMSILNKKLEEDGIKHWTGTPGRPQSQGIIERFNGTLKKYIEQGITATNNKNWVSQLQTYMDNYNNTPRRTTETAPNDINEINRQEIADKIRARANKHNIADKLDLNIGDKVRKKIFKGKLDKYSKPNWSDELHTVSRIIKAKKPYIRTRYEIDDIRSGDPLYNNYARNDLLKVEKVEKPPKPEAKPKPPPKPKKIVEAPKEKPKQIEKEIVGRTTRSGKKF